MNQRGVPTEMKTALEKGETVSKDLDDSMMALKWMDKQSMVMLITIHDNSFVTKTRRSRAASDGQEDILKPRVVEEYNKNMGSVDRSKMYTQCDMNIYTERTQHNYVLFLCVQCKT